MEEIIIFVRRQRNQKYSLTWFLGYYDYLTSQIKKETHAATKFGS